MTAVPADGYTSNATRTVAQVQQVMEDFSSVLMELIGGAAENTSAGTIASDAITPVADYAVYALTPESGTSDNLKTITTTNMRDGQVVVLRNYNSSNTVTLKHATGNMYLADGLDYAMNRTGDYIAFIRRGSNVYELWRSERNAINILPGAKAESQLTIATGLITPTYTQHKIETEAAAASDDLDGAATAFGGTMLIIRPYNASHVVVVRNNQTVSAGYFPFLTYDGNDITLDAVNKYVAFHRDDTASAWRELFRSTAFSAGGSGAFTLLSKSGSFNMNDSGNCCYTIDTSGGAATGTLQTSPADGRVYSMEVTSSSNNATIQTTGGQTIRFADGSTATSFTLKKGDGSPLLMAITGGYKEV